jgi:biotin synthase
MLEAAIRAEEVGAERFGIVTSGRGYPMPTKSFERILEGVKLIQSNTGLLVDVSLGVLGEEAVKRLINAGVERIHHNIETSPTYFTKIVSTHSIMERIETIRRIKSAGVEACSGFIIGMGEGVEDRIEMTEILNSLKVNSVPINILVPIPGTPLERQNPMNPMEAIKSIAAFRFLMPDKELRLCGGRTQNLRDLQVLSLFAIDGIMIGHKALTTTIRDPELDLRMLKDIDAV